MTVFDNMILGFSGLMQVQTLLLCLAGVTFGTLVGALPGVGAVAAVSMLLPFTYRLEILDALVALAGIFYGSQYGSAISSILLNIPGSSSSAVICLDGHPLAKQKKAGLALFISAFSSFIGGTIGIVLIMGFSPLIADMAVSLRAPDYLAMMIFALIASSAMSQGSASRGFVSLVLGVAVSFVGVHSGTGQMRFTFGSFELASGISFIAVAMGLFGMAEIMSSIGRVNGVVSDGRNMSMRSMWPSREDWRRMWPAIGRGTLIGSVLGALPGTGPTIASFMSYGTERSMSKHPEEFGKGAVEGVAAPEASNNAAVQTAFIPTLTLGIPGDALMSLLLGAMLVAGVVPGPALLNNQPDLFWGLVASFWVGNLFLLLLNIPLIGIWVKLLSIPYAILYPTMLVLIGIGVYSVNASMTDVLTALVFGLLGMVLNRYGYSPALVLLGTVLGPLIEKYFERSLLISRGSYEIFFASPISVVFLVLSALMLCVPIVSYLRQKQV